MKQRNPMTFEQWRDQEGFPVTSTQEPLWRRCWETAQAANTAEIQDATRAAALSVCKTLEAWRDHHLGRAMRLRDDIVEADRNAATNYQQLIDTLKSVMPDTEV